MLAGHPRVGAAVPSATLPLVAALPLVAVPRLATLPRAAPVRSPRCSSSSRADSGQRLVWWVTLLRPGVVIRGYADP
jgi:hypothetical protein